MKQIFNLMLVAIFITPLVLNAQTEEKKDFGIKFSGFAKTDFMYDSRQNTSIREGHFLLYPLDVNRGTGDGNDLNDVPNFNILSIQTRLVGKITGPDACGAKTSGVIEADFFGNEVATFIDNNGFRLRHAYGKLNWEKTEILFGQFWHPMFVTGCFPGTISFNTGAPFQPFSRNPQIRLTHKLGGLSILLAAQSQRDFTSIGGSTVLRNSGIPDMQFQLHFGSKNEEAGTELLAGAGAGYKIIKPTLFTTASTLTYKTNETLGSASFIGFFKYKMPMLTIKLEGVYGQNMADMVMLGGYAVHETIDPLKNTVSYVNFNTLSVWADIHTNGKKFQTGVFAGYTENKGTDDIIQGSTFARGANIKSVMRVSPRMVFIRGNFQFATEFEYTSADYQKANPAGTTAYEIAGVDSNGDILNTGTVANLRVLFSAIYSF